MPETPGFGGTYEDEASYQAALAEWQAKKRNGDPFPGPMPRPGPHMSASNDLRDALASPGATLDSTRAEEDRSRMAELLGQLQTQATTGGGAWEQALKQNTASANNAAAALGQSPGTGYGASLRSIGNAQGANEQRAVGQGNLLRAQTQQQATGQLADIFGGQMGLDATQAVNSAGANQGAFQMNSQVQADKREKELQLLGSVASAGVGMSEGGKVPGKPKVFGDDSANDTVPAKLTPQEIVLPLSVTLRPDAPEAAAAFVRAVQGQAKPGQQNFAPGGEVPAFGDIDADPGTIDLAAPPDAIADAPPGGAPDLFADLFRLSKSDPSLENGAILRSGAYDATRGAAIGNTDRLMDQYQGRGPSVAPQAMQNATDSTINEAMQARGPIDSRVAGASAMAQGAAGNAAGLVAGESQRGAQGFADAVGQMRAQDMAFEKAQQQALWRNTMMNAGIGLQQQAALNSLLSASAQGVSAAGGLFSGIGKEKAEHSFSPGLSADHSSDDFSPSGHSSGGGGDHGYAEGGIVSHFRRETPPRSARKEKRNPMLPGRPEDYGERPVELEDRNRIEDMGSKMEQERRKKYDRENADLSDLSVNFADGGEVPTFVFPDVRPDAAPPPGPFDARPSDIPSALAALAALMRPSGGPSARGEDAVLSPQQQAAENARRLANPPAMKPAPVEPHSPPARERPFVAQPEATKANSMAMPPTAPTGTPAKSGVRSVAAPANDPYAEQKAALGMKADAEANLANEQAGILGGLQKSLEQNAIAQAEARSRAETSAQEQLGAIQQAREELKNLDTTVDPGRYWNDIGIPGKIANVIGLALGSIGNDNGINRAAQLINQAIDRDIGAQKASIDNALRQGQSAVDSAQNIYSISRQLAQDDIAAGLAAKGTALDLAKNQVDIAAAKSGAPMAKANLANLSAQLSLEKAKADDALKQRAFDNAIKSGHLAVEREAAGMKAANGDKTQKALLDTITTEESTIKQQGEKLKALIKKYGTSEFTGPAEAEMRQAVNNMATAAAKMNDPASAARSSEVDAEAKNIFKPGMLQKADTALAQIDSYLANAEARKRNAFSARGVSVSDAPKEQAALPATRVVKGKTYKLQPNGKYIEAP